MITTLDRSSRAATRGLSDISIRNLFIVPTVLFLIVFNIFPLIYSLGYSFTDFRASTNAPANFVGLQNYRDLLNDPYVWSNFAITAKYVIISVAGQLLVGFGVAMLLNRDIPLKGLITTLLLLPMMLSMAVVGLFWKLLYDPSWGVINYALGLGNFEWLADPKMALYAVALTDIWMWSPFVMLLSLAGLSAVPKHLRGRRDRPRRAVLYVLPHHAAAGGADPDDRGHLPDHGSVQDFRPRLHPDQPADGRTDLDPALQDGVPGMADRALLRDGLHRADHGAGHHQHLRQIPQQGEGALRWPPSALLPRSASTASPSSPCWW